MAIENERRFLVNKHLLCLDNVISFNLTQGYLSDDPERIVRLRLQHGKAQLTIKGIKTDGMGLEFEYFIPLHEAYQIMNLCKSVIDKTRYYVNIDVVEPTWHSGVVRSINKWEIDVFHGDNEGLIIAELEFPTEDSTIVNMPEWVGEEITTDTRYANSNLANYPYTTWDTLFR
jgi:adenylate cyclase